MHLHELRTKIAEYLAREPCEHELVYGDRGRVSLRLRVREEPPREIGAIVGDMLHNLRSALDARVFAIAEDLFGTLESPKDRSIALPIADTRAEFKLRTAPRRKHLGDAGAEQLRSIVRPLQVFGPTSRYWCEQHGSTDVADEHSNHLATATRLLRIAALSNIDKHRGMHLPWLGVDHIESWSTKAEPVSFGIEPGPWGDGTLILSVTPQTPPTDGTERGLKATMTLVLPPHHNFNGGSVSDELDNLAYFVERALDVLEYEARAAT